jgi:colanic acid/amylovoran biosynthesis protein
MKNKMNAPDRHSPIFLISGAFLSYNLGTAAMVVATIDLIKQEYPQAEIKILSTRSTNDSWLYPYLDIIHDLRNTPRGIFLCARAVIWKFMMVCIGKDIKWLRGHGQLAAHFDTDIVVDLSGDTLAEDYGPFVLLSHCIPLIIAKCFSKPVILFGQTIGPFTWSEGIMRVMLKACDVIIARDELTYTYMKKLGIPQDALYSSIDTAFTLEPSFSERVIGLASDLCLDRRVRFSLGMTLSFQYRNFLKKRHQKDILKILPPAVDRFIETHDAQVVLFPHVTGPTSILDDRKMAKALRDHCRYKEKIKIVTEEMKPQEVKALISYCDLFCGARMHSNIAAITTGVPTIALSYSVKSKGIMGRMQLSSWVIEMGDLEQEMLYDKLVALYEQKHRIQKLLEKQRSKVILKAQSNIKTIGKIIQ